ncbi:uncharacterized protein LOC129579244 isoform X2 [Sitodiplosis mosellana]|uniref:uncharacterized protein LOC129579244 isoform X2 n=1 Tax=Sitodiplosis mosellana TaxID=263140 RepID=UPI002444E5F5|nr:uncharacterized protein LOC129579244 isoform X2 [Sitodiplosis mosellana]
MYSARSFAYMLLSICSIDYALGCYLITQNGTELLGSDDSNRVATNVNVTSGSNIIDCFGKEFDIQKIHISWTPSKVLPEHFNVTVQSDDEDFFAKKTIPGNRTLAAFGVLITPTRKYNVTIEAKYGNLTMGLEDSYLPAFTTFVIEKEQPCFQIDAYLWIGICTFIIVVSYALAYKCHADFDELEKDTKKSQYEKNLTEGNKLLLDDGTKKIETNNNADKKEAKADDKDKSMV